LPVALGGGTPTQDATWPLLRRNGVVVYLRCRVDELYRRLQDNNNRPLLRRMPPEQRLQRIEELLVSSTSSLTFSVSRFTAALISWWTAPHISGQRIWRKMFV